jgi:hypothetical protein
LKLSYLGYAFKGEHDHVCRSLGGKKMNVFCGCDMVVHGAPCGKSAPAYDVMGCMLAAIPIYVQELLSGGPQTQCIWCAIIDTSVFSLMESFFIRCATS